MASNEEQGPQKSQKQQQAVLIFIHIYIYTHIYIYIYATCRLKKNPKKTAWVQDDYEKITFKTGSTWHQKCDRNINSYLCKQNYAVPHARGNCLLQKGVYYTYMTSAKSCHHIRISDKRKIWVSERLNQFTELVRCFRWFFYINAKLHDKSDPHTPTGFRP
jgi:hypothetical protein